MICKNFVYDGYAIPYSAEDARAAGWYGDVVWTNVTTRNKSVAKTDFHGSFYDPTFATERLITISGEIFEQDQCKKDQLVFELNKQFNLATFPAVDEEYKRLDFEDHCGNTYFATCKVYKTMQLSKQGRCGAVIKFKIVLVAKDPFFRASSVVTSTIDYCLYGGLHLDDTLHTGENSELPDALRHLAEETMINNAGNLGAPTIFTLKGAITNPIFINYTSETWYGLSLGLSSADTLVIDSDAGTVEINGSDVSSFRMPGSSLVFLDPGENYVGFIDDTYNYETHQLMQQAQVEHYVTFL